MEEKKEKGERAFGVGLLRKKSDQKGKETVGSSSCWLCEDETTNGLGVDGSGMGMDLEVVVTGGIGGLLGLGPGNWQLAIGGGMGVVGLEFPGKQPKTRSSRPGKVNSGGIRRRQAASGVQASRRAGELCELNGRGPGGPLKPAL